MRLGTIWSLPDMTFAQRINHTGDRLALRVAERLPRRISYWATRVAIGKATSTGPYVNGAIARTTLDEVLKKLEGSPK